ncbi:hypothetical protein DANDELION_73 [Mycobacterium phage Dandelion]|uniref:Uncharacterized protein n=1 Tax=Mycobacterium phage Dandelion TaxID=1074305 RepID=G1JW25_9CAUD|nr:hypothetical protein DANDELION_73 [Mycobacterium phage Dandelion]AEL97743.1 hypothetical protein DANDELION_73 [Mycobacterium phage Dandelion]
MAYTIVDYGEQTPQTMDRFGTEQECLVWGRNGDRTFSHYVVPQRSAWTRRVLRRLQRAARREEHRFTWESTNVPGTMLYPRPAQQWPRGDHHRQCRRTCGCPGGSSARLPGDQPDAQRPA